VRPYALGGFIARDWPGKWDLVLFQQLCNPEDIVDLKAEPTYANVMQCGIGFTRRWWIYKLYDVQEGARAVSRYPHENRPETTPLGYAQSLPDPGSLLENVIIELFEAEHFIEWNTACQISDADVGMDPFADLDFRHLITRPFKRPLLIEGSPLMRLLFADLDRVANRGCFKASSVAILITVRVHARVEKP
jgi:hypothetical protein